MPTPFGTTPSRRVLRTGLSAIAVAAAVLLPAAVAQAHVQVVPDQTAAGSEITVLTFRVPTESATAGTSKVSISLPTDTPLAEVLAQPLPGWTVSVKEAKLPKPVDLDGTTLTEAPSTVTWTASKGQAIGPGQFQEFILSAGPIPDDAKVLSFPTTQTYTDGKVVKWNQPQPAGADEPEHPVPHFTVTAAQPDDDAAPATASAAPSASPAPVAAATTSTGTGTADSVGRTLGGVGLAVGLAGLGLGVAAYRKASGSAAHG